MEKAKMSKVELEDRINLAWREYDEWHNTKYKEMKDKLYRRLGGSWYNDIQKRNNLGNANRHVYIRKSLTQEQQEIVSAIYALKSEKEKRLERTRKKEAELTIRYCKEN